MQQDFHAAIRISCPKIVIEKKQMARQKCMMEEGWIEKRRRMKGIRTWRKVGGQQRQEAEPGDEKEREQAEEAKKLIKFEYFR